MVIGIICSTVDLYHYLLHFQRSLKILCNEKLLRHMNANNILVNEQFGFWTKPWTEKASLQLLNEILNAWNNKLMVGDIFCSWEKVFDCVHLDVLLSKWKFYGVTGKSSLLIKLYVENGHKRVIFNDQYANHNTVTGEK